MRINVLLLYWFLQPQSSQATRSCTLTGPGTVLTRHQLISTIFSSSVLQCYLVRMCRITLCARPHHAPLGNLFLRHEGDRLAHKYSCYYHKLLNSVCKSSNDSQLTVFILGIHIFIYWLLGYWLQWLSVSLPAQPMTSNHSSWLIW